MSRLSLLTAAAALAVTACRGGDTPRALLDRYFGTAARQEYSATYDCYDAAYHGKVTREEYVRHRKEASPLQSWRVLSVAQQGDRTTADVQLVFGPLPKVGRTTPVSTVVHEDLVREAGSWRIRVW
ncbi:MAG TPA: hypothetical protein VEM76_17640 [Anaeromyxobacteraceae bacterium]|nr:hypothetical protein [Anaeromyxobacteraceae bacterium]